MTDNWYTPESLGLFVFNLIKQTVLFLKQTGIDGLTNILYTAVTHWLTWDNATKDKKRGRDFLTLRMSECVCVCVCVCVTGMDWMVTGRRHLCGFLKALLGFLSTFSVDQYYWQLESTGTSKLNGRLGEGGEVEGNTQVQYIELSLLPNWFCLTCSSGVW